MELSFKKICSVCGDKALGYNFNALTCESCKAFFRRNALRNKNFRCSSAAGNNNNHCCLLTPDTRKYCRYCRLKKCFEIGMRKDWILTKQNKKKLNNHRKYRHQQQRYDDNIHPDSSAEQQQQKQSSKTNIILVPISVESMMIDDDDDNFENNLIKFLNKKFSMKISEESAKMMTKINDNNNIIDDPKQQKPKIEIENNHFSTEIDNLNRTFDNNNNIKNSNNNYDSILSNHHSILETNFDDKKYFLINGNDNVGDNVGGDDDEIECLNNKSTTLNYYRNRMDIVVVDDYITNEKCKQQQQQQRQQQTSFPSDDDDCRCDDKLNIGHEIFVVDDDDDDQIEKKPLSPSNNNQYCWSNISDFVYRHAIRLEHIENPLIDSSSSLNIDPNNINNQELFQLNRLEQKKLQEINYHLHTLYDFGHNPNVHPEHEKIIRDQQDGLKYLEMSMKKLIITVKNVPSFRQLCQEDQIQLLKNSAIEIKWIINLRFFDESRKSCLLPNPNLEERNSFIVFDNDYLQQTYGNEIIGRLKNFFNSFRYDWRNDDSILNLLSMMILFYPERSNLINRHYIQQQFQTFSHLLRKYLQVKYSSICEGRSIYLKLLTGIQEIRYLNEQCLEFILKMDMKFVGPLTMELYELKLKKKKLLNS